MLKLSLIFACLVMSASFFSGCETTQKLAEEPLKPITTPFEPLLLPVNDTVQEAVGEHKMTPAGLNTTVNLADQKQVRVAF